MNRRMPLIALVLFLMAAGAFADPPTHKDFRPLTFSRPSTALRRLEHDRTHYGYSSRVFRANAASYMYSFSPALSPSAAGRSTYYRSVIGNYGANPYSGLDASERLYAYPNTLYPPTYTLPSDTYEFYARPYYYETYRAIW